MRKLAFLIGLSLVAAVGGIVDLAVLANRLTERGLDADANGTAGSTTAGDYAQGAVGLVLVLGAMVLAAWALVQWLRARQSGPAPSAHIPEG